MKITKLIIVQDDKILVLKNEKIYEIPFFEGDSDETKIDDYFYQLNLNIVSETDLFSFEYSDDQIVVKEVKVSNLNLDNYKDAKLLYSDELYMLNYANIDYELLSKI